MENKPGGDKHPTMVVFGGIAKERVADALETTRKMFPEISEATSVNCARMFLDEWWERIKLDDLDCKFRVKENVRHAVEEVKRRFPEMGEEARINCARLLLEEWRQWEKIPSSHAAWQSKEAKEISRSKDEENERRILQALETEEGRAALLNSLESQRE